MVVGESHCAIEHCFYGYDLTQEYYSEEPVAGGAKVAFYGGKTLFSKEVVPNLLKEVFEVFGPLFEFVKSKYIPANA